MAITKADVDWVMQTYIRNNVNNSINPGRLNADWANEYLSGSTGAPGNSVNTGLIGSMSSNPGESRPSQNILAGHTVIGGAGVRAAINTLARYYSGIALGRFGLIYQWCVGYSGGYSTQINSGLGYFNFNNAAPGIADKRARFNNYIENRGNYPDFNGKVISLQQLQDEAWRAWTLIYNTMGEVEVNLVVCHSSCHNCCHGARGRR